MKKTLIIFCAVSVTLAFGQAFVLNVDLKNAFGVGLLIGLWLFSGGIALVISSIVAGTYWLIMRKLIPGYAIVLWVTYIIFGVLGFVGNYVSLIEKQ